MGQDQGGDEPPPDHPGPSDGPFGPALTALPRSTHLSNVDATASGQTVTVAAGSYEIRANISDGAGALEVSEDGGAFVQMPTGAAVSRAFMPAGALIVLVSKEVQIRFPLGTRGLVGVTGAEDFPSPTITES